MVRVLITGMSGTGKSALVHELRRHGHAAYDADDDGYAEPRPHGGWGWRLEAVRALFAESTDPVLYFAGCSEEQALLDFDLRVLLTCPERVLVERIRSRTSNPYGKDNAELERILADRETVEPLLRRSADLVVDTRMPVAQVADLVARRVRRLVDADRAQPR